MIYKCDEFIFTFNKGKSSSTCNIYSFKEYTSLINKLNEHSYYYRAQSDPYWPLENTFSRLNREKKEKGLNVPNEIEMIKSFYNSDYCKHKCKKSLLDIIAEMQHYGAFTRLLDFTKCSLTALYFTIKNANLSKDEKDIYISSIYLIKKDLVNNNLKYFLVNKIKNDENFKNLIDEFKNFSTPVQGNPELYSYNPNEFIKKQRKRIEAQNGLFIFSNNPLENIDKLIKIENFWYPNTSKEISPNIKIDFNYIKNNCGIIKIILRLNKDELIFSLKELDKQNKNGMNLFPDEEGFLKYLNMKII